MLVAMERRILCHDPGHTEPAYLRDLDGAKLQSVVLGDLVRMNVGRSIELRLLEAGSKWQNPQVGTMCSHLSLTWAEVIQLLSDIKVAMLNTRAAWS